uniref:Integrase, catalytic region, zinc finger, CCHC-type, peptidase aspartic, catalytic n=1 Tax=Tanacetum cinerariifolium TaxID=118510 RepID=A0A6L2JDJ8_TANCI|nr:hypothetical protein [Tanacetum cinerariifolium]
MAKFPQIDSGLGVPVFKQGDDPIDVINKMMSFLSTIVTSHFPSTNNQLRNFSNPRQQATIHDGRVTVQPVQGRQNSFAAGMSGSRANISRMGGNNSDPGIVEGPVTETVITHNAAYQADDLDAYDTDCDDLYTTKAVLMANLSSYGSNVLSDVPHSKNTHTDMLNQSVQEMSYSEQTHLVNYLENEITSDSNIITYSQYLLKTQNTAVQDTNSSVQQDAMILSVFKQLSNPVTNCNKVNKDNLTANESLSVELERYKERVNLLEERQNVDLKKPTESEGFEQIIDLLIAHPIKYALTVNLIIYSSCIEQFWATAKVKHVNEEAQLHVEVDGKRVVISEASIRSDLRFGDKGVQAQQEVDEGTEIPTDTLQTPTIIQPKTSQPQRKQKTKKPRRKDIELPQTSVPTEVVADEAIYEEMYDSVERAATTATGLDAK